MGRLFGLAPLAFGISFGPIVQDCPIERKTAMLTPTLTQMAILACFILIGFTVARLGIVPKETARVLSKLENAIFIPALVMGTFYHNFTRANIGEAGSVLLFSVFLSLPLLLLAHPLSRLLARDSFLRRITVYGLAFPNFGFFGMPLIAALFPQYNLQYIIYTLPMWVFIYVYATPFLLMETADGEARSLRSSFKNLLNPMLVGLLIGALLGVAEFPIPSAAERVFASVVDTLGACMSPIAMMITGITFASMQFGRVLKNRTVWTATAMRLLVIPFAVSGLLLLLRRTTPLPISDAMYVCTVASLGMPLGLNTVVVPAAYGRDTSVAAGMALVSHTLVLATLPLVLTVFL